MLRRRMFFHNLFKRGHSTNRSRVGRGASNPRNLKSKLTNVSFGDEGNLGKRKFGRRRVDSEEGRVRKRWKIGGHGGADDMNADMDRTSELPEPIIHHILSFLRCTKDVVRMSILSKRWKTLVDSYPLFDFDERWFRVERGKGRHNRIKAREVQKKKFKSYVERSLAKLGSLPSIDKFRLYVNSCDSIRVSIRDWVCSVLKKNVKELDIHFDIRDKHFVLPCEVLTASSITSLKLSGSALFGFTATKMLNLRELSIKDTIQVNEYSFKKFEEGCPLIEDLRLVHCGGLFRLSISTLHKLRRVEVHQCTKLSSIDIEAANLETFWYHGGKYQLCKINLKGSGNLKNLTLKDWLMTDAAFQDFVSKCPLLETLVLQECNSLERLTILSDKLKKLTLIHCSQLHEANIDAPNLYSFEYCGHRIPFSSMNVLGLREVKLSFGPSMKTSQCIVDYRKLFGNVDHSKNFKLIIYSKQIMKIYEEPREARRVPHFFRKLELTESLTSVVKIVDNWLRECHGRSLTLVASSSELTKRIHSLIMDREDNPNCCRLYSNKCWQHYVADVKTSTSNKIHKTFYEFKWKPGKGVASMA